MMEGLFLAIIGISDAAALVMFIFACLQSPSREQKMMMLITLTNLVMNVAFTLQNFGWDDSSVEMASVVMHFAAMQVGIGYWIFLCRITFIPIPKRVRIAAVLVNVAISIMFATDHYTHLMYITRSFINIGRIRLMQIETGPLYSLYLLWNIFYLIAILITVLYCASKKSYIFRNKTLRTNVIVFLIAGTVTVGSLILTVLQNLGFDYSVSACCASTALMMVIMYRNNVYDMRGNMQEDILDDMDDIIIAFDRNHTFLYANAHCLKVFPELVEYRNGMPLDEASEGVRKLFGLKNADSFIIGEEAYSVELRVVVRNEKRDGTILWLKNITKENNYIIELEFLRKKLFEKIELQEEEIRRTQNELENLARNRADAFDVTTGLMIRASGENHIISAMKETGGALIFFDVDNLKKINDIYGHEGGDRALNYMGQVLKKQQNAICCRMGGDEFLCFIRGLNERAAEEKAHEIINDYFEMKEADVETRPASLSAGIAITQIDSDFHEELNHADKALYHVKQNGKADLFVYRETSETTNELNEINLEMFEEGLKKSAGADGALNVEFRQFSKLYEYIRNMESRYKTVYQLMMIELVNSSGDEVAADETERAMQAMQHALMDSIRNVDVYTRYGRNRYLLITTGATDESLGPITDRIISRYHALYTEDIFEPAYEFVKRKD